MNQLEEAKPASGTPLGHTRVNVARHPHVLAQLASIETLIFIGVSSAGDLTAFSIPTRVPPLSIKARSADSLGNTLCRHTCRLALNNIARRRALA